MCPGCGDIVQVCVKDSGEDSLNTNAEYQVVLTIKIGIVRYILNTNTQLVYLPPEKIATGFDCELEAYRFRRAFGEFYSSKIANNVGNDRVLKFRF